MRSKATHSLSSVTTSVANDRKNIDPNIWGPPMWNMLFTFAFALREDSLVPLQRLFLLLEHLLPCAECRRSYIVFRARLDPGALITLSDSNSAAKWLWSIHDMVNQKLGKLAIGYEQLETRFHIFGCMTSDQHVLHILSLICIQFSSRKKEKVEMFVTCVIRLMQLSKCGFVLPRLLEANLKRTNTILEALFATSNELRTAMGTTPFHAQDDFVASYNRAFD